MKRFLYGLVAFFLALSCLALPAYAAPPAADLQLTGQIYYENIEGGFYGILGDDGNKYQPVNLPRKLKKEGSVIKFSARLKPNTVSLFQWGTIIELLSVNEFTTPASRDERQAIWVLNQRMAAFNSKSLTKLQAIDLQSRQLTAEQFQSWLDKYEKFTLQYVELESSTPTELSGVCFYTRQRVNAIALFDNDELAGLNFTISKSKDGWRITAVESLSTLPPYQQSDLLTELRQKTKEKFGTDHLGSFGR